MRRKLVWLLAAIGIVAALGCNGGNTGPDSTASVDPWDNLSHANKVTHALTTSGGYVASEVRISGGTDVSITYRSCDVTFSGNEQKAAPPESAKRQVVESTTTGYALWWILRIEGKKRAELDASVQPIVWADGWTVTNVDSAYLKATIDDALKANKLTCS